MHEQFPADNILPCFLGIDFLTQEQRRGGKEENKESNESLASSGILGHDSPHHWLNNK
jgi:hypothetical protein